MPDEHLEGAASAGTPDAGVGDGGHLTVNPAENAQSYFRAVAVGVLGTEEVWPVVQKGEVSGEDLTFPSVVYRANAPRTLTTLRGVFLEGTNLLFQVRSKEYSEATATMKQILDALRMDGRTNEILQFGDDYNRELDFYVVYASIVVRL